MSNVSDPDGNLPGRPSELTWSALGLGLLLSIVMGAANVYLGLRVGMTVSASIPAAVLAMGILQGLMKQRSILEANVVQTTASAGESLAAGIIFTIPALMLTGAWTSFDYWTTSLIALSGGLLGVLMMIPMRRAIVVDSKELKFPEGVACAEVLRVGAGGDADSAESSSGSRLVFGGLIAGAVIKVLSSYVGLLTSKVAWATRAASRTWYFGMDVSPALVGVGLIVGLPVAAQVFIGGALGWFVLIPLMSVEAFDGSAADHAFNLWETQVRYVGVGAMVVGGLSAIWKVKKGIAAAFRELTAQMRSIPSDGSAPDTERTLEFRWIMCFSVLCAATVFGVYFVLLERSIGITLLATFAAILLSFFFSAVASYIVGLVGNSNSPVSGMTITAVLITGLCLYVGGYTGNAGIVAMLGVAGVVCCAACTSGDVCNDLKTGQLVGASPRSQQIAQILGVTVAAFVMAPVLTILHQGSLNAGTGGIGGTELAAPQAALFASLAKGFFGDGQIPWNMVGWGVVLAVVILIADKPLATRNSAFRLHVMPVAVGVYLPAELSIPILIGGIVHWLVTRGEGENSPQEKRAVLVASGIIAGESLTGVFLGLIGFLEYQSIDTSGFLSDSARDVASLIVLGIVVFAVYRVAMMKRDSLGT